jgi:hypothetical protein
MEMVDMLRMSFESPRRVPPPTPVPPQWLIESPSTRTRAVPVPMLTTIDLLMPVR